MTPNSPSNFESTDCLGLKPFCERIESFILVEHDYVDGSLVLGLNAGFGAGKTTFLNMWERDLRTRREQGQFVPMPLVLNAWESDYCGDPLLAILANLIEVLDEWNGEDNEGEKSALKEAAKDMAWFALGLGNGVAAKFTGVDAVKAADLAEGKKNARKPQKPDFIEFYHQRADALKVLKEKLTAAFGGESPKILVFVDELDRCRPDYAVSYLETIKHVFDVQGMVFVLAIDYGHLANSAKALFGQDLVFEEYFRKFCHRIINLPEPDEGSFRKLSEVYISRYLAIEGKRQSLLHTGENFLESIVKLAHGLKMRPRQIQEGFRILGHTMVARDPKQAGQVFWALGAGTLLLCFLSVARPEIYEKISKGDPSLVAVGKLLVSAMGKDEATWWVQLYFTGTADRDFSPIPIEHALKELGYIEEGPIDIKAYTSRFSDGWGRRANRVGQICGMINSAQAF
jgi:hypothetical protein